jgi:hypothetical protein
MKALPKRRAHSATNLITRRPTIDFICDIANSNKNCVWVSRNFF